MEGHNAHARSPPYPIASPMKSSASPVSKKPTTALVERPSPLAVVSKPSSPPSTSLSFPHAITATLPQASTEEKTKPVSRDAYVPPWVSRNVMYEKIPTFEELPWKKNEGVSTTPIKKPMETSPISSEKKIEAVEKKILVEKNTPIGKRELSSLEKKNTGANEESGEVRVEELSHPARPISPTPEIKHTPAPAHTLSRDHSMEEEISEEEALEKLPFEDVEGLSPSDLDYLAQKEKEHREAEEKKEMDMGNPDELKSTLQRQSTQLDALVQAPHSPTMDEKQEILRRLKKMMEEEKPK